MTDTRNDTVSVVERTRAVATDGAVIAAHFLGRTAVFVLAEESLLFAEPDGELRRMTVHDGAILATVTDGARIISGGDDGKVVATDIGASRVLATDPKRRWIDHVALGPDGAVAWSAGKTVSVQAKELRVFEAPSTAGGLAFLPKGFRLAVAHYSGASLWFPNAPQAAPEVLEWKGSHLGVTVSPDGRFLVTSMQEPMLHGWRLVDSKHMRMSGYAARVTSLGWTAGGGGWLATSGATQLILWPFQSKDGPMGKTPRLLAPSEHRVVVVACHPKQDIIATGYGDGMVLLVRIEDGAEILAKGPGNAPVAALAWSADGLLLAFATESGEAGIVDLA